MGRFFLKRIPRKNFLRISASTIDRMFQEERGKYQLKGRQLTRPGNLLKNQIPIRTFSEWNEEKPGFLEMDLLSSVSEFEEQSPEMG